MLKRVKRVGSILTYIILALALIVGVVAFVFILIIMNYGGIAP